MAKASCPSSHRPMRCTTTLTLNSPTGGDAPRTLTGSRRPLWTRTTAIGGTIPSRRLTISTRRTASTTAKSSASGPTYSSPRPGRSYARTKRRLRRPSSATLTVSRSPQSTATMRLSACRLTSCSSCFSTDSPSPSRGSKSAWVAYRTRRCRALAWRTYTGAMPCARTPRAS